MKLEDTNISVRLRIGFGIILLFVIILGAVSLFQGHALWNQTASLFEHPFDVRKALGSLKADILTIHRNMKDMMMVTSEEEWESIQAQSKLAEADIFKSIDVLYAQYLGPKSDVDALRNNFVKWNSIREETNRILHSGTKEVAFERTKYGGEGGKQVELLLKNVEVISSFATAKAEEFYTNALILRNDLIKQMVILLILALFLGFIISFYLVKIIQTPLKELSLVTSQFQDGNYDARSTYLAANEMGLLASSFNKMAETIQTEMILSQKTTSVANIMLQEEEFFPFCRKLLESLMHQTNSQTGAVYLLNEQQTRFEPYDTIGLRGDALRSFDPHVAEGEIGMLLATGEIQHLRKIPADTMFSFITVSGEMKPREILSIPIFRAKEIIAIISLSCIYEYQTSSLKLIRDILPTLTARLNGVRFFDEITVLAKKLELQNTELTVQKSELATQTTEMAEQNTELEMQKRELNEANRLKSAFLSNMSHELRTPLNSIIALSGVLSRRLIDLVPDTEYSYLDVISRNGNHLLSLINDILDISRIESGKIEFDFSLFQPRGLIEDVVLMIEPQAIEKGIALVVDCDPNLPEICSDYNKIRHILQNLISNAIKFTPAGEVHISAFILGDQLKIAVSDTGIGIDAEKLPHIFDEFRQADETTARRFGGTGLGLAIAKKYAIILKGKVEVKSTIGEGSVFTISLPLDSAEKSSFSTDIRRPVRTANIESPLAEINYQELTIMVVEDSEPQIIQLLDILQQQGYKTTVAKNGREALELIALQKPDGIILDLMMPEVDGFTVLRELKTSEESASIPVLILTAKHVTKAEYSFLTGNQIYQLIQKGDVNKSDLLREIHTMLLSTNIQPDSSCFAKSAPLSVSPSPTGVTSRSKSKTLNPLENALPSILIVEDNEDNMLTIKALLDDKYQIIEATDGESGVQKAREYVPDLILMDIALPGMNGLQAMDVIRNTPGLGHIPIVAVTASVMKGNREEILAYGFDGFIAKPINHNLFYDTIEGILYGAD